MFSLEDNGVRPCREGSLESWHQALPHSSKLAHNPERYNWGDVDTLFEDQVQVVTSKHLKCFYDNQAGISKGKDFRILKKLKLKRLDKPRIGGKLLQRTVPAPKSKKLRLKLGKHDITAKRLLQKTQNKLMKALRGAAKTQE